MGDFEWVLCADLYKRRRAEGLPMSVIWLAHGGHPPHHFGLATNIRVAQVGLFVGVCGGHAPDRGGELDGDGDAVSADLAVLTDGQAHD